MHIHAMFTCPLCYPFTRYVHMPTVLILCEPTLVFHAHFVISVSRTLLHGIHAAALLCGKLLY